MAEKKAKPKAAPKPIHSTALPYKKPAVDQVEQPHHDIIADRLVNLLRPIQQYRAQQPVSKGKNSRKRKRKPSPTDSAPTPPDDEDRNAASTDQPPSILQHLLIGFNHVTRHLESLSTLSAPSALKGNSLPPATTRTSHFAGVFLFHPLDELIYAHLPTLCHTASLAHPDRPATRLVLLDPAVERRVAEASGLTRTSVLGLLDSEELEEVTELVEYVREHVGVVEVEWLKEAKEGKWMGTRVVTK